MREGGDFADPPEERAKERAARQEMRRACLTAAALAAAALGDDAPLPSHEDRFRDDPGFVLWNGNKHDAALEARSQLPPRNQVICELADVRLASGWDLGDCRNLHLRDVKLNESDVDALAASLSGNTWLLNLDLGNAGIGAEGASRIASAITPPHKSDVHTLLLSKNELGDEGAIAFAATLRHNRKLLRIDLGSNGIGDPGAVALARALERNADSALMLLGLSWNQIGDEGAAAFAETLRHGAPALESLLLSANMITDAGALDLLRALPQHPRLEDLDIDENFATAQSVAKVEALLRKKHPWKQEL